MCIIIIRPTLDFDSFDRFTTSNRIRQMLPFQYHILLSTIDYTPTRTHKSNAILFGIKWYELRNEVPILLYLQIQSGVYLKINISKFLMCILPLTETRANPSIRRLILKFSRCVCKFRRVEHFTFYLFSSMLFE